MKLRTTFIATAVAALFAWTAPAFAHCDTLDGPVVAAPGARHDGHAHAHQSEHPVHRH